ncbi:MAG: peptidase M14 [Planctomycetes bacterium]|nr:peptidase M14 [Planctomycetota bacterium]
MKATLMLLAALALTSCLSAEPRQAAPAADAARQAAGVTTPAEHLGRPVGADHTLADWGEVSSWFRLLSEQSPRVRTEVIGKTTEDRDFLLSVISSEENLASLDRIRADNWTIADPRGRTDEQLEQALARGKVVIFVSIAMHATECAGPQFGMELAHRLATDESEAYRKIRENVVVLLAPSLNPDGQDHVTEWYRETVGTPYEASDLLKLYQYYAGHDNNRDWFMLTQDETRIVTEQLYRVWKPQVYWDVHQQGSTRERFFVPPFRDPLDPNLEPRVITAIDALGSRALFDMTQAGFTGVSTGVSYDMWWNGGNRNVPVRHGIVGLLTEAASANLATPMFIPRDELRAPSGLGSYAPSNRFPAPWPGGWWRIRDIIDYELAFADSLLGSLAREPRLWLENSAAAAQRATYELSQEAPRAWILPSDNRDRDASLRLVDTLMRGGVEVHVAQGEVRADGRTWPAGSVVILREQPYGTHVKDLMEVQRYPAGDPPYDVAGWTLPYLLGVHRVECIAAPEGELKLASSSGEALEAFAGVRDTSGGAIDTAAMRSWARIFQLAGLEEGVLFHTRGERAGLVTRGGTVAGEEVSREGANDAKEGAREAAKDAKGGAEDSRVAVELRRTPRVGLYAPWRGDMNEGWMRWTLDEYSGLEYVRVRNEHLRAGALAKDLDVLILPGTSSRGLDDGRGAGTVPSDFTGGLDPEGAVAIEEFVREGGTLIAVDASASWAVELFGLPLEDTTRGEGAGAFSCPGSVLRGVPVAGAELCAGLPSSVPLFFSNSRAWSVTKRDDDARAQSLAGEPEVLLRYAPTRLLLSGWISEPERIEGRAAWVRVPYGAGDVHCFAFRPQYRGWSQATMHLLFRSILSASF